MSRMLLVLLFAAPAFAQPARNHDITIDDYATLATIRELAVSPDGKMVAYTEARWDKADDLAKTNLWVVATDGKGKPTRLTGDRANDRHPKWSADGKSIFVLGNRKREAETKPPFDGKTQVWRVDAARGVASPVTTVEGGVTGYDYAPWFDKIVYSVDAKANDQDDFTKLRKDYKLDYGHGVRTVSELHRLDLNSWRTEKIYNGGRYVREFAVNKQGMTVAMITAMDDSVVKSEGESRVEVWSEVDPHSARPVIRKTSTDVYRKNAASPHAWLENLRWSDDNGLFAFNAIFDGYPAETMMVGHNGVEWDVEKMPRTGKYHVVGYGRGAGPPMQWPHERAFHQLVESEGVTRLMIDGNDKPLDPWINHVYGFSAVGNYMPAFIATKTFGGPDRGNAQYSEMALLRYFCKERKEYLSYDPNPHVESWHFPVVKHITWNAPDGTSVGGVLELPPGDEGKTRLPLVVAIHGGPTTSSKAALEFDPHNGRMYFSCAGYAVLCPNYRGSTGYGDKFVTDLIGNENDIEVKDILAGIQHLIKEGIADPERIGVMGWSNGGYLTNCLITLKDSPVKFKAASSGAGILDTVAEWGFNDEPAYTMVFKKGLPWETPNIYRKTSPTYGLGNLTTPTLIHVGANDVRCPPGHSRMLYRALKEYKKVPTELVVYPGEPHGLTKLSNRLAKMQWDLAWFDKYVKGGKP